MAQTVANDMVKDKEKALKAAQNAKSKGGATIAEKIASEQERKANIQNAEQELAIWQAIASVPEARQQAMAQAQAEAQVETVEDVNQYPTPTRSEDLILYHGTPFDFDVFDANEIGTAEGGSKGLIGINLSEESGLNRSPKFANIKSEDAPIHLGVARPTNKEVSPRILTVSGKDLKLYDAKKAKGLNQDELVAAGYDGVRLQSPSQITIFPESIHKLNIEQKQTIEEFIASHPEVEKWVPWTTNEERRKAAEAERVRQIKEAEEKAKAEAEALKAQQEEIDENGHPFVLSSDGTTSFGEIREGSGLPAAPIKLSEGYHDENGKGYGLVHIEANHGEQIRNSGFASVKEFVSFVAKNYDEDNIRVGKRRDHIGTTTYLIQVTDEHDNTLFIELSRDGSYWNVNSGGIFRKGYSNKKETVVKTEPQQPNNAVSTGSSLSVEDKSGISATEPNGEPTVSNSKDTTSSQNNNEIEDENVQPTIGELRQSAETEVNINPTEAQKEVSFSIREGNVASNTIATEVAVGMLKDAGVEVVEATDAMAEAVLAKGGVMMSMDSAPFYSNAKKAVLDIKQDKATPQQWVAMLKKNGGLKAGEDAWLGLESWLSGQTGSVTKQEIIDYIDEHAIEIEEVNYGESEVSQFEDSDIYNEWAELGGDEDAFNEMIERYGDDFEMAFLYDEGQLYVADEDAASFFIDKGTETINETRLSYTTEGLTDNREIALTVPTIEPYNQNDDIHFGDAGGGRAVAWVRFGETKITKRIPDETAKLGYRVAPVRVLVIDEIQSVRHQDGREKGYRNEEIIALENSINSLHEKMHGRGLTPEEYRELTRLREEQREIIINADPELKAESDRLKELTEQHNALEREDAEKFETEAIEIAKLKVLQEDARTTVEYEYVEEEIRAITEGAKARREKIDELLSNIVPYYDKLHKGIRKELIKHLHGVPVAPFEKNWHELAMKRMLRYAAENGYDKVAWTTGAQQAARYDMRQQVDNIQVEENNIEEFNDGTPIAKNITINTPRGNKIRYQADAEGNIRGGEYGGKNLKDVVGKELAEKIMQPGSFTIEEEGLAIGGEGMKGFYDKMLPSFVNKYTKKWGAKVGEVTMPSLEEGYQTMHSVDVTPQMKEDVMKGQPMFLRTPNGTVYGWTQGGKVFLTKEGMNAETPIHEYTHLWDKMVQQKNPELWNRGKELLKQTPTWNEVVNDKNYANIAHDEDAVASEVHSRLSGENGAKVLEQMIKDARKDGAMAVAKAASITERIKEWVKDMFVALKETLSAWSKQDLDDLSIEDFNNLTLRDLAEGVNPNEYVTEEGDVQFSNDDEIPRLTKKRVEKIFGGIWIRDKRKFAKFASAVNTFGFEEDGEGITFTDNFFYAYYRNIDGQVIPYASVYMNRYVSQDVVNEVNKELANVEKGRRAKFYFDRAVVRFRAIQKQDNADNGNNQGASDSIQNLGVVRRLLRKGEYYYHPNLYVKTRRNDEVAERQGSGGRK